MNLLPIDALDDDSEAEKVEKPKQPVSFQQVIPLFSTYLGFLPSFQRLLDLVSDESRCQDVWRQVWNRRAGVNISFVHTVPYDRHIVDEISRGDDVSNVATWLGVVEGACAALRMPPTAVDYAFMVAFSSPDNMNPIRALVDYFCRYVFLSQIRDVLRFILQERENELARRLRIPVGELTPLHRQQYPNYSRITREQLLDCIGLGHSAGLLREIGMRVAG